MPFSTADPAAYVALAMQSALGTLQPTPAKYRFARYAAGNSVQDIIAAVDLREGGDGLDYGTTYEARQTVEGQLVFNLRPEMAGQFFQLLPGAATWSGASLPAAHTFHMNHASHPWSTMQIAYPATNLIRLIRDVRFLGANFSFQTGQPLMVTAPFRGIFGGASTNVALVPSQPNLDALWAYHFTPSILLDGVADSTIDSISLDLSLGVEDLQAQNVVLDEMVVQNRDLNVTVTRRYENATLYKKIYMGGGVAPTQTIATGALSALWAYGGGGSLAQIKFDVGVMSYRGNVLPELNPDGVTVKETITAKALKGGTSPMTITLTNQHASAYGS